MSLEAYQEIILTLQAPAELRVPSVPPRDENPSAATRCACLPPDDERIAEIKFSGKGVHQPGLGIDDDRGGGMHPPRRSREVTDFLAMMRGEREFAALDETGELAEALKGVLRSRCA